MSSKDAFQKKYSILERFSERLPPVDELTRFLKFYLTPYQARYIEKKVNYLVAHPDEDSNNFVTEAFRVLNEKLLEDRRGLKESAKKLIMNYREQMRKTQDCKLFGQGTSSYHSCDQEKTSVATELIEGLDSIIPEAKRSNFKKLASHVSIEDLDDFLKELQEDLNDFLDEREVEITRRLQTKLEDFLNELLVLSKQLKLVTKINMVVEAMTVENVPEEAKKEFTNLAERITNILKNNKLTPDVAEDISKLTNNAIYVSESVSTARFRNAVKELQKTAKGLLDNRSSKDSRSSKDRGSSSK